MSEAKRPRLDGDNVEEILKQGDQDTRLHIHNEATLKKHLKDLDRKTTENNALRVKFPDDPTKFVQSECDLCEEIAMFKALAANPELIPQFQESALTFLSLLNHQNPDITMLVTSVLSELTHPDVLNALDDIGRETGKEALGLTFVRFLMAEIDIFASFTDNLNRLNEFSTTDMEGDEENQDFIDEFKGVTDILTVVSNLCDALPELADKELLTSKTLLSWMLRRIKGVTDKASTDVVDYNRLYCAEILSSLLQRNSEARTVVAVELKGLDAILETVASFRRAEAFTAHEEEFLSNLKNCIICFLLEDSNKDAFCEAEGVSLMTRLLVAKVKVFHEMAVEILALAVTNHKDNCGHLFAQGLGGVFAHFVAKASAVKIPMTPKKLRVLEQLSAIMKGLATQAQGEQQERLIAKLFENDCAKLKVMVALMLDCFLNMRVMGAEEDWDLRRYTDEPADNGSSAPTAEEVADYDDRCEAGLVILQNMAVSLLSLCRYGNDIITMQVHVYLDQTFDDIKLLNIWANTVKEYTVYAPMDVEIHKGLSEALDLHLSQHQEYCKRVENLKEEAVKQAEVAKQRRQEAEDFERDEARRVRNRDRKAREKIKKYDRELERREQLEEYRYARKTGTLW
eukprot:Blabericola_migrator_1__8591@NODE_449_length_8372_cov_210_980614_g351_i0_p2_GENE_NODE_449_length_8372_cov_210_980614_g351_i0NODE_449_length_8372_cov_210_980614_g351_i0_p2_ORF_typecomplete_len627_score129_16CTNNBL/PF08216_11/3_7e21CTNNBL/PF08216_11/1_8e04Arm_2/PF04826_13/88Arm_2/PF04826_13/1_5e03Arm_2/PF04826_13/1_4Arm_2/PF04826_13/4_7e03KAP/PF05804_12/70KAP/PF05804_12/0_6SMC_N/PF02463_19/0_2AAA_23/PF13476_6/0_71XRN_M/PF17846_1/2_9_NODE_449_length_8372_cov_210_980614_g351_i07212601